MFSCKQSLSGSGSTLPEADLKEEAISVFDLEPEYKGGDASMSQYLFKSIVYPERALRSGITDKVKIELTVEKDSSVRTIKILDGIGYGCDEESAKVEKVMPHWLSAKTSGKKVRAYKELTIGFI